MKMRREPITCPVCGCPWLAKWVATEYPERVECLSCGAVTFNILTHWVPWKREDVMREARSEDQRGFEQGLSDDGLDRLADDLGL